METKPFLLGVFLIAGLVPAQAAQFEDLEYTSSGTAVIITGYTGPGGAVSIPDTINGLPVASIEEWAFAGCAGLTSITIPDSVTSIGGEAFEGCTGLTNVVFGNSVTSIGWQAFYGCTGLTSITIPDSATSIEGGCTAWVSNYEGAVECCGSLTDVSIYDSVTTIDEAAFAYCTSLISVTIPNLVTWISGGAFSGKRGRL